MTETGFNDRSKKPIYIGDILEYRLSLNSKKGGPTRCTIINTKKGLKLSFDGGLSGWIMRKSYEQYIAIIDTSRRKSL